VDALNPAYSDVAGVLFNKSQTILVQSPAQRTGTYAVPNTVRIIGNHSFERSALHSIALPTGVTNIGDSVFNNATNLINLGIPDTVTNIGASAFAGCSRLASVIIPDGVTSIGTYTFYGCKSLTNLHLGRGVREIGPSALYGCSGLTELAIPDSVTNLEWQAFLHCSGLRKVWVGKGVASIGSSAFLGCVNLAGIYFTGNAPTVGSSSFGYSSVIVYYLPQTTGWGPNLGGWPTKLWNPTVPTSAPDFGVQNNKFGFTIIGTADIPIAIEAAAAPAGAPWTLLQSGTLTNGAIYFSDAQWTNFPARSYRIRSP
jgi:hypothetical protein